MLTDPADILAALAAPFGPDEIDWRVGATNKEKMTGLALAYQDARTAMDRLDDVCGGLWTCDYQELLGGKILVCRIGIKLAGEWVYRTDGGDAGADDARDFDMERKEALSDAFKRAAVRWGVGRFLYGFESPWVKVVPQGAKSFAIHKDEKDRLRAIAEKEVRRLGWTPDRGQRPLPPRTEPSDSAPRITPPEPAPPAPPPPPRQTSPHGDAIRNAADIAERVNALAKARRDDPQNAGRAEALFAAIAAREIDGATDLARLEILVGFTRNASLRGEPARKVKEAIDAARERLPA